MVTTTFHLISVFVNQLLLIAIHLEHRKEKNNRLLRSAKLFFRVMYSMNYRSFESVNNMSRTFNMFPRVCSVTITIRFSFSDQSNDFMIRDVSEFQSKL